jgi:tetratricopeptide (TPR) repeat protein
MAPEAYRNPQEARALAEKATEMVPDSASFWNTLGVSRYRCGLLAEAIEAFEKSEALGQPESEYNYYFLAICAFRQSRFSESKEWFDKAEALAREKPNSDPWLELERKRIREEAGDLLSELR